MLVATGQAKNGIYSVSLVCLVRLLNTFVIGVNPYDPWPKEFE